MTLNWAVAMPSVLMWKKMQREEEESLKGDTSSAIYIRAANDEYDDHSLKKAQKRIDSRSKTRTAELNIVKNDIGST